MLAEVLGAVKGLAALGARVDHELHFLDVQTGSKRKFGTGDEQRAVSFVWIR